MKKVTILLSLLTSYALGILLILKSFDLSEQIAEKRVSIEHHLDTSKYLQILNLNYISLNIAGVVIALSSTILLAVIIVLIYRSSSRIKETKR